MSGRPPNQIESTQLRLSTTPQVYALLERLVESGLYGKGPPEAAERLISEGLQRLLKEGVLLNYGSKRDRGSRRQQSRERSKPVQK